MISAHPTRGTVVNAQTIGHFIVDAADGLASGMGLHIPVGLIARAMDVGTVCKLNLIFESRRLTTNAALRMTVASSHRHVCLDTGLLISLLQLMRSSVPP